MWFNGVRISTLVTAFVIIVVAVAKRKPIQGVMAVLAWILGFEAAWQLTAYYTGHHIGFPKGWWVAPVVIAAATLFNTKVSLHWIVLTSLLWMIWIVLGFNYNLPGGSINIWNEIINETTKTAWAMIYIWPLIRPQYKQWWVNGNLYTQLAPS